MKKNPYPIVLKILIIGFFLSSCGSADDRWQAVPANPPGSSRLSELLRSDGIDGYATAVKPRKFKFPDDHGPHSEFRNEWWYFTGNLDGEANERFGFELTIFRFSLTPAITSAVDSAWQTNQVFIGHFAITDVGNQAFHVAQRYSRGAVGLAGASAEPFRVWIDDWSIAEAGGAPGELPAWRLQARDTGFAVELDFVAEKPVVLNGDNGLSRKSAEVGNASYYYSLPRLRTSGSLFVNGQSHAVTGLSWLDREWGSSALARDQRGWDWFALQLSDGTDLMFYVLRGTDGAPDEFSAGTWIDVAGVANALARDDVVIEVTDTWQNERGDRYPSAWNLSIPDRGVEISVRPVLADQELTTNVRYWEGAVDVEGSSAGRIISGRGYVELTGYAGN